MDKNLLSNIVWCGMSSFLYPLSRAPKKQTLRKITSKKNLKKKKDYIWGSFKNPYVFG